MQPCLQIKLVIFKMHPSSQDFTRISPEKTHLWTLAVGPHSSETLTVEITGNTRDDGGRPPTSSRGSRVHTADTINLNIVQRNHKGVKSFYYFIISNTREPHLWNYRVIDIDVGEGSQQVLSARVRVKWYVEHRTRSRMATQHITTEHRGHRTQIWEHTAHLAWPGWSADTIVNHRHNIANCKELQITILHYTTWPGPSIKYSLHP